MTNLLILCVVLAIASLAPCTVVGAGPPPPSPPPASTLSEVKGCDSPGLAVSGCVHGGVLNIIGQRFGTNATLMAVNFAGGIGDTPKCNVTASNATTVTCTLIITNATRGVWEARVSNEGVNSTNTFTAQFVVAPTNSGVPQLYGIQGCRVNGVAAVGCSTGSTITLFGTNFSPAAPQAHVVSFAGGNGGLPTCSPVTRVTTVTVECSLVIPAGSSGIWRVGLSIAGQTSISVVTLDVSTIVAAQPPSPANTPSSYVNTPQPTAPNNVGNSFPPVEVSTIEGTSASRNRVDTGLVSLGAIGLFVILMIAAVLLYKRSFVPWVERRKLAKSQRGPRLPPDLSAADAVMRDELTVPAGVSGSRGGSPQFSTILMTSSPRGIPIPVMLESPTAMSDYSTHTAALYTQNFDAYSPNNKMYASNGSPHIMQQPPRTSVGYGGYGYDASDYSMAMR